MTLKELYNDIIKSPETWSYYKPLRQSGTNSWPPIYIHNIFEDNNCEQFIKDYFGEGGKGILIEGLIVNLSNIRKIHTVSCFFLGIQIAKSLFVTKKRKWRPSFCYYWFLSSLYHDFGYQFEENITLSEELPTNEVYDKIKIPTELEPYFSKEVIEHYSEYRNRQLGDKYDHGITGGKLLYDKFDENFKHYRQDESNPNKFTKIINGRELLFNKKQYDYIAEAALAIMLHNIWFCNEGCPNYCDKDKYTGDLRSLVDKKVSFSYSASLYFLLLIADTIEPTKRIINSIPDLNDTVEKVLNYISISFEEANIIISYDSELINLDNFEFGKWKDNILFMDKWMNITTEEEDMSIKMHILVPN